MIKLKSLIKINEQVPGGPPAPGAPQPLQTPPAPAMPEEQPVVPEPETDTTPAPEDPGEYDWTKDFRTFEDAKNKAEAAAKKKLLDKMNKSLVGKKITVNASRGYGQPKTDYTIDKVKKISVEFWYKEWVVIITDENDKKFFLTPGVNIKIEGGDGAAPEAEAPAEPEAAPTGASGEEEPNASPTQEPPAETGTAMGQQPDTTTVTGAPPQEPTATLAQPGMTGTTPPPAVPGQPPVPTEQPPAELPPKKKKRVAEVNKEMVAEDLKLFLMEFINNKIQKDIELINYIKDVKSVISEGRRAQVIHSRIEIPVNYMVEPLEVRDLQLAAKEAMWSSGNIGERFSRGSLNVSKVGRVYIMEFVKETGWKS